MSGAETETGIETEIEIERKIEQLDALVARP